MGFHPSPKNAAHAGLYGKEDIRRKPFIRILSVIAMSISDLSAAGQAKQSRAPDNQMARGICLSDEFRFVHNKVRGRLAMKRG